jgi:hypothetical protein
MVNNEMSSVLGSGEGERFRRRGPDPVARRPGPLLEQIRQLVERAKLHEIGHEPNLRPAVDHVAATVTQIGRGVSAPAAPAPGNTRPASPNLAGMVPSCELQAASYPASGWEAPLFNQGRCGSALMLRSST